MTAWGGKDDSSRWKPRGYETYLTRGELCAIVGRDRSRILQLERAGKIPSPIRVSIGKHRVRLYSPGDVAKVKAHFA